MQYARFTILVAAVFAATISHTPAHADDSGPRRVALLVGVDQYLKPGFKDLEFAEADVTAVAKELETLGFEVTTLLGSAGGDRKATLANIEAAAKAMVVPLGKQDIALVMLSGHGQTLRRRPDAQSLDEAYYCPVDAVINEPETQFSLSYLLDKILAPNVGRKMLLVDACRDAPPDVTKGARNPKGIEGRIVSLPEDTAVFFSCRAGQLSFERHELGHGLFTHCVLDALRGGAARQGEITWAGVVAHVNQRMAQADVRKFMPKSLPQIPIPAGAMPYTVLGRVEVGVDAVAPPATPYVAPSDSKTTESDERLQLELAELQEALFSGKDQVAEYFSAMAKRRLDDWRVAAAEGSPIALYFVARCKMYGVETPKDQVEACIDFRRAGEGGVGMAWNNLGAAYQMGRGVKADDVAAADCYRKGAEAGCATAMYNLGRLYEVGRGVPKSPSRQFEWFLRAAEAGEPKAIVNVGIAYHHGRGVTKDYAEARLWYLRGVALGDTGAMNNLGNIYAYGEGVATDYREAMRLYQAAAERGDPFAMNGIGFLYGTGKGVSKSRTEAIRWYRKAWNSLNNEPDASDRKVLRDQILRNLRANNASP